MFPFYTPWKYLKIFEVFSEGIKWERSPEQVKQVKACIRYFSLFLKEQYVSWLFRTKYFEIKFNLQLLYLLIVSRTFILPWATTRCPTS